MNADARKHLAATKRQGRDLHACPVCGRLYECDAVVGPLINARHWVKCADHGQQVGVGEFYLPPTKQ